MDDEDAVESTCHFECLQPDAFSMPLNQLVASTLILRLSLLIVMSSALMILTGSGQDRTGLDPVLHRLHG
jgi:hypothetical protein